jgi:PPP4R2
MSITLSKMAQSYKVIKTNSDISYKEVLPPSLRKILKQCARNGRCNWLEWQTAEEKQPFTQQRNGKRKRPDSSGEKSGSELEAGSIQYECDSEGTSTTNSELSRDKKIRQIQHGTKNATQPSAHQKYTSLRLAFSKAIRFSLDQFYNHRGGYKLSPLEEQSSPEIMFKKRRQKILDLCIRRNNPPFTLQRLAEVLLTPHRFYQQTHKLCNCLEKLLMVTSSIDAYGGSTGGASAQSLREVGDFWL